MQARLTQTAVFWAVHGIKLALASKLRKFCDDSGANKYPVTQRLHVRIPQDAEPSQGRGWTIIESHFLHSHWFPPRFTAVTRDATPTPPQTRITQTHTRVVPISSTVSTLDNHRCMGARRTEPTTQASKPCTRRSYGRILVDEALMAP